MQNHIQPIYRGMTEEKEGTGTGLVRLQSQHVSSTDCVCFQGEWDKITTEYEKKLKVVIAVQSQLVFKCAAGLKCKNGCIATNEKQYMTLNKKYPVCAV